MARWVQSVFERTGLAAVPMVKKVVVAVIGTTVLLIGLVLIVLPGPAILVIPLGLAILASEFAWARRVVRRGKVFVGRVRRGRSVRIVEQNRPTT
ncbi:MAG: PGPGW domain-containing protein [Chthoniobacterales bacterium]